MTKLPPKSPRDETPFVESLRAAWGRPQPCEDLAEQCAAAVEKRTQTRSRFVWAIAPALALLLVLVLQFDGTDQRDIVGTPSTRVESATATRDKISPNESADSDGVRGQWLDWLATPAGNDERFSDSLPQDFQAIAAWVDLATEDDRVANRSGDESP